MCGIAGLFDPTEEQDLGRELIQRMTRAMTHRGPDAEGYHVAPGIALGHRRLSIIDLSGGRQPLYNEDESVCVTYNGEIYNFRDLTDELLRAGHRFRTHCDTEVIVHAWEEWGEQCVTRFNGMFAFAIWDSNQKKLFLGRDRFGVKPLYFAELPDGLIAFASELKGLLVLKDLPRKLDAMAVEDYFALGYVPDPRTILAEVKKLPPGHTLCVQRGSPIGAPRMYWDLRFRDSGQPHDDEAGTGEELIHRLREAVKLRLIADVPLGAFLSGGIDSSAVVAMMAGLQDEPVRTCSISFTDPRFDEIRYARIVAQKFGTDHREREVDPDDFSLLEDLVDVYDEPFADSSAIPTYRVCQIARENVTVALSGDGGDESFAGYRRYRWHANEERFRSLLPPGVRRVTFGLLGQLYPKMDWAPRFLRAKATLQSIGKDTVAAYLHGVSILAEQFRGRLFSESFVRELQGYRVLETFREWERRSGIDHPLSLIQYLDFKTYLPGDILTKVDRASMAHSLEVREPLLDYRLVEWIAGLRPALKLRGQQSKYILKRALERHLPHEILYRDKMGFAVPITAWFRGPLREHVRKRVLDGSLAETGMFDRGLLVWLVDQHQRGLRDFSAILWALLMFEGFCRRIAAV